jgi:hypothetical protein
MLYRAQKKEPRDLDPGDEVPKDNATEGGIVIRSSVTISSF